MLGTLGCFRFPPSGLSCIERLTMTLQKGSERPALGRTGPTQHASNQEREMGLSLRSAHSSNPVLDTNVENGWKTGDSLKSCCSLENWPCWAERGMLHLLQNKKRGDKRRMRWRDKGARARICLISGDNFPSSCAPCLYAV